jgi:structural maintenance of chromosome 4
VNKIGQDEEDEMKAEPETPISATQPSEEQAGEEEKSLFESPPMPEPSSLPKTMPEEPSGPKDLFTK